MGENYVVAMYGSRQHSVGEGEGVHSHKRYKTLGKKKRYQIGFGSLSLAFRVLLCCL